MSTLSPDQWQALSPYLDQALAMTDDERTAWLASLGEQDPALAVQLRELLDEHRALAEKGFLENGRFVIAKLHRTRGPDTWSLHPDFADWPRRNGKRLACPSQ